MARPPVHLKLPDFTRAVEEITSSVNRLFTSLEAPGLPRTREAEKLKALQRGLKREEQVRARVLRNIRGS